MFTTVRHFPPHLIFGAGLVLEPWKGLRVPLRSALAFLNITWWKQLKNALAYWSKDMTTAKKYYIVFVPDIGNFYKSEQYY
jgi:hypothetical protein